MAAQARLRTPRSAPAVLPLDPAHPLPRPFTDGCGVVDYPFCRSAGIDMVRRPTGGRAVLHHRELTYAVAGIFGVDHFPAGVQEKPTRPCARPCAWGSTRWASPPSHGGAAAESSRLRKRFFPASPRRSPGKLRRAEDWSAPPCAPMGPLFSNTGASCSGDRSRDAGRAIQLDESDYPVACASEWLHPFPSWRRMLGAFEGFVEPVQCGSDSLRAVGDGMGGCPLKVCGISGRRNKE